MSPEAQAINDIIVQVKPELMWTLVQSSVIAIVIMVFYKLYKTLAAYISFRTNKEISNNVKVVIGGREAIIVRFNIRGIFLRFKDNNNELIIPMHKWEERDWELVTNGKE